MLPSHGNCFAVFLLSRAFRLAKPDSISCWVRNARDQSTFLAGALDLELIVESLIRIGLAKQDGKEFLLEKALVKLAHKADFVTLSSIAHILLDRSPPNWIVDAVRFDGVALEYIPTQDLDALTWLGEDLTELLIAVAQTKLTRHEDEIQKLLGDAGERVVLSSNTFRGFVTSHVAQISDSFGYDIEIRNAGVCLERIEVKSALAHTNGRFYISKNEASKAALYKNQWRLVQVTFDPQIMWKRHVTKADVLEVRMLSSQAVLDLSNTDTDSFRWLISGEIRPSTNLWERYELDLPDDLSIAL